MAEPEAEAAPAALAPPAAGAAPAQAGADDVWYALSPDDTAKKLQVDPAAGLSASAAAALLAKNGPNALAVEKAKPEWRRFLDEYRSYMQIILVVAGVVSFVIAEWSTGALLFILTVLNAVVGLREEGKAESAMNALKSMMKSTARVRRDGAEAKIAAEELVVGDVVLLAAGDQVPADGRIVEASALQIDESALTGESTPAAKGTATLGGADLSPADQTNMAFMNTPVTHGSGVMIVTGTGAGTQVGRISGAAHDQGEGADAAAEAARPHDALDRRRGAGGHGRDVRPGPHPRSGVEGPLRDRRGPGHRRDPRGAAHRGRGDPLAGRRRTWPSATPSSRTWPRSRPSAPPRRSTPTRPARSR